MYGYVDNCIYVLLFELLIGKYLYFFFKKLWRKKNKDVLNLFFNGIDCI